MSAAIPLSTDDLGWFFDESHHAVADQLRGAAADLAAAEEAPDEPARDRAALAALARHRLLELAVPPDGAISARSLCLARELLGWTNPRADSIFAVQGLGTYPISVAGSPGQRAELAGFSSGKQVAAFALTEPEAGSDVAAIATTATPDREGFDLSGDKTLISNLGLATHATVFASTDRAAGRRGLAAFWVRLDAPGVEVSRLEPMAGHPLGRLALRRVPIGRSDLIGEPGGGFELAMTTLDTFRVSVAAAAVGMARRALAEAVAHVRTRVQFGKPLAEQPLVQAHLADMATRLDGARLLTLRAAYLRDRGAERTTTVVSMAKLDATEAAHDIIDRAVQLLGGRGCLRGAVVEHLYRAVRPLRIYEGTSEIQRTIIGRAVARGDWP